MGEGAAYPGWELLNQELKAAVDSGEGTGLSSVQAMTVLGEMQRLNERLEAANGLLRQVREGSSCWHAEQGYSPCSYRGVELFLDEAPRRRWWQRRS